VLHGFGTRENLSPLQVRDFIDYIVIGILCPGNLIKIILCFAGILYSLPFGVACITLLNIYLSVTIQFKYSPKSLHRNLVITINLFVNNFSCF